MRIGQPAASTIIQQLLQRMSMGAKKVLARELLLSLEAIEVEHSYTSRDTILYNLGIGFGAAAVRDSALLRHVLESELVSFPTMSCVLGASLHLFQDPRYGIDFQKVVHGEEEIEVFGMLQPAGTVRGVTTIEGLWDRGVEKGAVMRTAKTLLAQTGERIAICRTTTILRGNGGFGGSTSIPQSFQLPTRDPDGAVDALTRPEQALIYRLSGDTNPLHAVPAVAKQAGFPGPILHGLCSFGVVARALVVGLAEGDASRLRRFGLRFTSPVYPGETLRIEYWRLGGDEFAFQARVIERDCMVLSAGRMAIAQPDP
jgi:acyl dehydratase